MKIIALILGLMIFVHSCNYAQKVNYEDVNFKSFCDEFKNIIPVSYIDQDVYLDKIPDAYSKKYLGLSDKDLIIDDGSYNYDDDVWTSNWRKREPLYVGKIECKTNVIVIYKYLDNINNIGENWISILLTFGYNGKRIDKIEVSGYKTIEEDNLDCVFLNNQTFRLFDYKVNPEHTTKVIDAQGRTQYVTHEEIPWTICTITEYRITDAGKIEKTGWTETKQLKESVTYYRQYHKDSDDPMNEYK